MNSKREFRLSVRMYKANVVPRSLERTVLVDIVKIQLKPIAMEEIKNSSEYVILVWHR